MILNTNNKVIYIGNGVIKEFPYTFDIDNADNMQVMLVDLRGNEFLLTKDFFVDTVRRSVFYPGYSPGQEPPLSEQPPILPNGWRIILFREIPVTQKVDFGEKWPFYIIEKAFDKVTMLIQEALALIDRSIVFPISENFAGRLPAPIVPNASIAINSTGDGLRYGANPDDAGTALLVAGEAKEIAIDAKNIAKNAATRVESQIIHIDQQVIEATNQADRAEEQANLAELYAQAASLSAELYNPTKTYNPPDMVVVEGQTYRCIETSTGEYPPTSSKWIILVAVGFENFEYDENGDIMPLLNPKSTAHWQLDEDNNLMPAA